MAETGNVDTQETVAQEEVETTTDAGNDAPAEPGEATTTSEPIELPEDHPLVKTLAAQKELIKELKKRPAGDDVAKVDELTRELETLRQENESLRLSELRSSVAAEKGVPAQLLVGSSKEELVSFADALLEFRGQVPAGVRQSPGQGVNSGPLGDGERTADEIVNAAYQRH